MGLIKARFDDLWSSGSAMAFAEPDRVITAWSPGEVMPTIVEAEKEANAGSWVAGFIAYEAAPGIHPRLVTRTPDLLLPLVWFAVFPHPLPRAFEPQAGYSLGSWEPEISPDDYRSGVSQAREQIRRGETYQVNFSTRLRTQIEGDALALYRDLARAQRGSHAAYIDTGEIVVVSASPELFLRWEGSRLTCRPMKGTAPRGRWAEEDEETARQLAGSEKNRAENIMIVDLVRNDLGRVAVTGSVDVESLCEVERYDTLWQLTSTVSAQSRPGMGLADVLAATFPCGSVTGAPKVRTMEVIAELESSPRGVYCGSIGLLAPPGSGAPRAEFSVAIRTVVVHRETGRAEYGVGGGVTYGSTPGGEHREALWKGLILRGPTEPITLLETMRWEPDQSFHLLGRHLERLRRSAQYFGIPYPEEEIAETLGRFWADETSRVRLLLSEEGGVSLEHKPLEVDPEPVRLVVDTHPVDPVDRMLYHKTTDRRRYDRTRERHPAADDVVLVNPAGEVTETTIANIAVLIDGRWMTPPLASGCLPGTYRAELLAQGYLTEAVITVDDLASAEEVAVFNSVSGWRAAFVPLERSDRGTKLRGGPFSLASRPGGQSTKDLLPPGGLR